MLNHCSKSAQPKEGRWCAQDVRRQPQANLLLRRDYCLATVAAVMLTICTRRFSGEKGSLRFLSLLLP